jgi:putative ABC transport system permease protein
LNRGRWFIYFLKRSLAQRKGRVAVASISVMIATAIVVSALGLSLGIRKKLGGELKAYGANVIVTPREGYIDEEVEARIAEIPGVSGLSGQFYSRAALNGTDVELIGLDLEAVKGRGWKLEGKWPGEREVLLGASVRDALGLGPGEVVALRSDEKEARLRVSGILETGGPEDTSVIMGRLPAQGLAGLEGKLGAVLVRAETDTIETTVDLMRERFAFLEVKTLRQVAYAEESFLGKIELLMALVTLVVLLASSISVSSTMSATVIERMKDIGLMKAIGGTKKRIRNFYLAEGCAIGLIGGLSGYAAGFLSAQAVSGGAFGSYIEVPVFIFALSLVMGVFISVSSSLLPLADALRYKPSTILRGE